MVSTSVRFEVNNDLGKIVFSDNEGKPIVLDHQILDELDNIIDRIVDSRDNLRVIIIKSDSLKYFVVGANVKALEELNTENIVEWVKKGHRVFKKLEDLYQPVIARIDGYALGGGLELAMACDLIVATSNAKFGQPEAKLGFVSGWGGSYRLPRRVGIGKAKEMFFTGKIIDAGEASKINLIDYVGTEDEVGNYLTSLFSDIRKCSPLAISMMKEMINNSFDVDIEDNCQEEIITSNICLGDEDTKNRVRNFLEKKNN